MILYFSLLDSQEDQSKFTQLYNKYRLSMMYTADSILNDHQLAEDAVHDAFLRIAKNFHKVGPVDSPRTKAFVIIIVRNVALTIAKRRGKQFITDDETAYMAVEDKTTDRDFNKLEYMDILRAIGGLPVTYRDVLYLNLVEDYNSRQISEMLQISNDAVKKRLQRGKKILIDKIRKENLADV